MMRSRGPHRAQTSRSEGVRCFAPLKGRLLGESALFRFRPGWEAFSFSAFEA